MRIKHLPIILSLAAVLLFSGYEIMYPGGAPAATTGSPGDGATCTNCHGGTATSTPGLITSNIPVGGYIGGNTYQITVSNTLTGTGKYGFEVSPQNAAGVQLGTLVAGTGSKLVTGGTKYITQSNASSTNSTWTFGWIAPVAGTGPVTFYGAMAKNFPGPVTLSKLTVPELNTTGIDVIPASATLVTSESNGFITVVLNTFSDKAKITVFDLSGKQLISTSVSDQSSHRIDRQFKPGVYIIVVQAGDSILKKKIVIA